MDIKVRTQTGVSLFDCTHKNIGLYGKNIKSELNYIVAGEGTQIEVLGQYENEERAEEILNAIQQAIENGFKQNKSGIIIQMPEN